ncbi:hypothetical protein Q3G72_018528 [Acer saccharum]|nr:hypothetical protein Q3G72_018528 [Acer saccharum]
MIKWRAVTALVCSANVTKQKPDETVHTCNKQTQYFKMMSRLPSIKFKQEEVEDDVAVEVDEEAAVVLVDGEEKSAVG